MTITKEKPQKYIDGLDIDKLNNKENTISMTTCSFELALTHILKECQKPKELTLHEKLINAGFKKWKYTDDNSYDWEYISNERKIVVLVGNFEKSIKTKSGGYELFNIPEKHIFEAIDFLTKWQS